MDHTAYFDLLNSSVLVLVIATVAFYAVSALAGTFKRRESSGRHH